MVLERQNAETRSSPQTCSARPHGSALLGRQARSLPHQRQYGGPFRCPREISGERLPQRWPGRVTSSATHEPSIVSWAAERPPARAWQAWNLPSRTAGSLWASAICPPRDPEQHTATTPSTTPCGGKLVDNFTASATQPVRCARLWAHKAGLSALVAAALIAVLLPSPSQVQMQVQKMDGRPANQPCYIIIARPVWGAGRPVGMCCK